MPKKKYPGSQFMTQYAPIKKAAYFKNQFVIVVVYMQSILSINKYNSVNINEHLWKTNK